MKDLTRIAIVAVTLICSVLAQNCVTDCHPSGRVTEAACLAKGCIYCAASSAKGTPPSCHLPPSYGYINEGSVLQTDYGYRVNLKRATNITYFGGDAEEISIFFYTEYNERLRIKVTTIDLSTCIMLYYDRRSSWGWCSGGFSKQRAKQTFSPSKDTNSNRMA